MSLQTVSIAGREAGATSHSDDPIRWEKLYSNGVASVSPTLAAARILFSAVLLNSVVSWNDLKWTDTHFMALVPFLWGIAAFFVWALGLVRWKRGGRLMAITDLAMCAGVIVFFPTYILPALALSILSCTFLVLRHDGRFGGFLTVLPLTAMLVHPLGSTLLPGLDFPAYYLPMGIGGEIVAFLLSSLVVLFSVLIIIRIRLMEQPLTFRQPWEEEFGISVGKHNIAPVIERLSKLYPAAKVICVLDSPKSSEGISIITNSAFSSQDVDPVRAQLSISTDEKPQPYILSLENSFQVDVTSGMQEDISLSIQEFTRGLTSLGLDSGVLMDFKLGHIQIRLFFSTGTSFDEVLRKDVTILHEQLTSYFRHATDWDIRRQEMIALARDLARRDLHDGVLQSLAALKMRLVTVTAGPAFSDHPEVEVLRKTIDIITVEQARLRALLHNDEEYDDAINLVEAIEVCLQTLSLQWEIEAKLVSNEPALPVDQESADNIEYLIREAIANAIRHSGAKDLSLALALNKGDLMITLRDNRLGLETDTDSKTAAQSILKSRSLHQRLTLVNGRAYSENLEDSTLLAISIPMDFTANA